MTNNEKVMLGEVKARVDDLHSKVEQMHGRIFNGMAKEIRDEVAGTVDKLKGDVAMAISAMEKKFGGTQRLVVGILVSILVLLATVVLVDRLSAMQLYKAVVDLQTTMENHIRDSK